MLWRLISAPLLALLVTLPLVADQALAQRPDRVLSHTQLLKSVWGPAHVERVEYLRIAVRGLRQKLEVDPAQPTLIINELAVGYRLRA